MLNNSLLGYILSLLSYLLHNFVYCQEMHRSASNRLWSGLSSIEDLLSQQWQQCGVTTWLMLLSMYHHASLVNWALDYCSTWPSIIIHLLLCGRLKGALVMMTTTVAVALIEYGLQEALMDYLTTWQGLSTLMICVTHYALYAFGSSSPPKYVSKRNRANKRFTRLYREFQEGTWSRLQKTSKTATLVMLLIPYEVCCFARFIYEQFGRMTLEGGTWADTSQDTLEDTEWFSFCEEPDDEPPDLYC